jgi:hypothetical protein
MRSKILKTILKLIAGTGIIVMAYCIGAGITPISLELSGNDSVTYVPETSRTPTVEAKLIGTHTVEYIEEKVIETAYVDVIHQVQTKLKNFTSLSELEDWLMTVYAQATIRFKQTGMPIDCDDYAFEMQQKALGDGFIMSFDIISVKEYNELFAIPLSETQALHAINLAIIGNSVFYIEPQTGETVHAAYLD